MNKNKMSGELNKSSTKNFKPSALLQTKINAKKRCL